MAHLVSVLGFLGLLAGLATLLERIVRESGPAIRAALLGSGSRPAPIEAALERIGTCLRASFPARDQDVLNPDLCRLLLQLSADEASRARHA